MEEQLSVQEQIKRSKNNNHRFFINIIELIIVMVLFSAAGLTCLLMFITNVLAG